jgi:calcium-dependent protein kinase
MLTVDPKKRITADEALKDPWFTLFTRRVRIGSEEDKLDPKILERLRLYRGVSTLKKAAMNLLVKMADNKDIEYLREMFMRMDKDQTGDITANELKEALNEASVKIDDKELEDIINNVDYHGDRLINYSEFLSATIQVKNILTDEKLKSIFKQFDTDSTGKITAENIIKAMQKLGHTVSHQEIKEMFERYDIDNTGDITFDEFKLVFENFK